jgi:hypothetical protein
MPPETMRWRVYLANLDPIRGSEQRVRGLSWW